GAGPVEVVALDANRTLRQRADVPDGVQVPEEHRASGGSGDRKVPRPRSTGTCPKDRTRALDRYELAREPQRRELRIDAAGQSRDSRRIRGRRLDRDELGEKCRHGALALAAPGEDLLHAPRASAAFRAIRRK